MPKKYYQKAFDSILDINKDNNYDYLRAYLQHNYAITEGYKGKTDSEYKKNIQYSRQFLKENDPALYVRAYIESADIEIYRGRLLKRKLIDDLCALPEKLANEKHVDLRIAIIYLLFALNEDEIDISSSGNLSSSFKYFNQAIESTTDTPFMNYWAHCGLVVTSHLLKKDVDNSHLKAFNDNEIHDGYEKARRFPIILFLLIYSHKISGREFQNGRWYKDSAKDMDKLLKQYQDDIKYQKFIIQTYKLLLNVFIEYYSHENINNTNYSLEFLYKIIQVNERFQNRVMMENLGIVVEYDKNIDKILAKVAGSRSNTAVVYFTGEIKFINNSPHIYMIYFSNAGEYFINLLKVDELNNWQSAWENLRHGDNNISSQRQFLAKLGKKLFNKIDLSGIEKLAVIPNSIFLGIPIHLLRMDNAYLFENKLFSYWPSLQLAVSSSTKKYNSVLKTRVFNTNSVKASIEEGCEILNIIGGDGCSIDTDPSMKNIIETYEDEKINTVHFVTHCDGKNIKFKKEINALESFETINGNISLVVLNLCYGGDVINYNTIEDHYSLPHLVLNRKSGPVISHTGRLGQRDSFIFSSKFYQELKNGKTISNAFQNGLCQLRKTDGIEPSNYGGYMLWGNGDLIFNS